MQYKHTTIILGAGSSKAYSRHTYPLIENLISEILVYADKLPGKGGRQRLYLAYALSKAYEIDAQEIENVEKIKKEVIQEKFENAKHIYESKKVSLTEIFKKLSNEHSPTAYWALSSSIGIYMLQMAKANIHQFNLGYRDKAHRELLNLINKLLFEGCLVTVVDFNYDCILEYEKTGLGKNVIFNWNCGRERKVIADTSENRTLAELVAANCFMKPMDHEYYKTSVELIKPHGDYCTFLLGDKEIYYRGGRHSHTPTAIFPEKLGDISLNDKYVRSSILPPTETRFRHQSTFYDEEIKRMKLSLSNCEAVLIIGWSARGTDSFYKDLFKIAIENTSMMPDIYIIDKSSEKESLTLVTRIKELFNNKVIIKHINVCGFDEGAVRTLGRCFFKQNQRGN